MCATIKTLEDKLRNSEREKSTWLTQQPPYKNTILTFSLAFFQWIPFLKTPI
jgi:hypothetical protein